MSISPRRIVSGHPHTFVALGAMVASYLALPGLDGQARVVVAWDVGALLFLGLTMLLFLRTRPDRMPDLAESQAEGQYAIFWATVLGTLASFVALTGEFSGLRELPPAVRRWHVALVALTLVGSWLLAHVVFALRYAHEFYDRLADGQLREGLQFPGCEEPDYLDFLYFAVVIGMTFQVSDVQIASRRLRRLALLHGLLGFLFNTVIVALTVNIAAGLL